MRMKCVFIRVIGKILMLQIDWDFKSELVPVIVVSSSVISHLANKVAKSIVFYVQQLFLQPKEG